MLALPPARYPKAALASLAVVPLLVVGGVALLQFAPQLPLPGRYAALCVLAYFAGSVSWGYALLIAMRGEDIRDFGSGRTGMSNMLRTAGGRAAAAVFVLDCGKGVLMTLLARYAIGAGVPEAVAALVTLCGHNWPVFLGFRGGRGILPGLGGLAVMSPLIAVAAAVLFAAVTLSTRYLSLGSIMGTLIAIVLSICFVVWRGYDPVYAVYAGVGGALIIWQHRDNIQRLAAGQERRIGVPAVRRKPD